MGESRQWCTILKHWLIWKGVCFGDSFLKFTSCPYLNHLLHVQIAFFNPTLLIPLEHWVHWFNFPLSFPLLILSLPYPTGNPWSVIVIPLPTPSFSMQALGLPGPPALYSHGKTTTQINPIHLTGEAEGDLRKTISVTSLTLNEHKLLMVTPPLTRPI